MSLPGNGMDRQRGSSFDGRGGAGGVDDGCRAASLMGDRASAVSRCGGEGGVTEGSRRLLLRGKREGPAEQPRRRAPIDHPVQTSLRHDPGLRGPQGVRALPVDATPRNKGLPRVRREPPAVGRPAALPEREKCGWGGHRVHPSRPRERNRLRMGRYPNGNETEANVPARAAPGCQILAVGLRREDVGGEAGEGAPGSAAVGHRRMRRAWGL